MFSIAPFGVSDSRTHVLRAIQNVCTRLSLCRTTSSRFPAASAFRPTSSRCADRSRTTANSSSSWSWRVLPTQSRASHVSVATSSGCSGRESSRLSFDSCRKWMVRKMWSCDWRCTFTVGSSTKTNQSSLALLSPSSRSTSLKPSECTHLLLLQLIQQQLVWRHVNSPNNPSDAFVFSLCCFS